MEEDKAGGEMEEDGGKMEGDGGGEMEKWRGI